MQTASMQEGTQPGRQCVASFARWLRPAASSGAFTHPPDAVISARKAEVASVALKSPHTSPGVS